MRHYELLFIVRPTLTDEEIQATISKVKETVEKEKGEIVATADVGVRDLAYEMQKSKRGYYYAIFFKSEGQAILEVERTLKFNESIIKFMFAKYETKKDIKAWETMVKKAKGEIADEPTLKKKQYVKRDSRPEENRSR